MKALRVGIVLSVVGSTLAAAQRPATFIGRAFADTTIRPIAGVEVTITDLALATTTDAKGAFKFDSIPVGSHKVRARKIGYAAFEADLYFGKGERVERGIILPRLTRLDTLQVVDESNLPLSFLVEHHVWHRRSPPATKQIAPVTR